MSPAASAKSGRMPAQAVVNNLRFITRSCIPKDMTDEATKGLTQDYFIVRLQISKSEWQKPWSFTEDGLEDYFTHLAFKSGFCSWYTGFASYLLFCLGYAHGSFP